ncbi:hypothetical protein MGN70_013549 [Eutypa lata]|nr:hypothetical protein MGN70_013549 [Eutypa lata]
MGIKSYFKVEKQPPPPPKPSGAVLVPPSSSRPNPFSENEKPSPFISRNDLELLPPTPRFDSSRNSTHSGRSMRSGNSSGFLDDIRHQVMVTHMYQQQCSACWVGDGSGEIEGVVIRKARGHYLACPEPLIDSPFAAACAALNVQCAMTVNSRVVKAFLDMSPDAIDVPLMNGLRIQILPSVEFLPRARKHQFAAFIASDGLLVVWDDDPMHLMDRAKSVQDELMELVWKTNNDEGEGDEKNRGTRTGEVEIDEESGQIIPEKRPIHLQNTILVSVTLAIITVSLGAAWRQLSIEVKVDGYFVRLALVALAPVQIFFTLFFAQVIVGCLAQIFGPIRQLDTNSKFYSARLPYRLKGDVLPHLTVQCPVYKEGLNAVIAPTVRSLKQAISTYELQGGSANIFVNDDGLQLLPEEERQARIDFYADHSIGWVARPRHGENGFLRRGKFKKASNMNFALMISCKVEEKLALIDRPPMWSQSDEATAYEKALNEVLEEDGRAWADGNIRVGDYILISKNSQLVLHSHR